VQISAQLVPPYSGYLPDYADPTAEKLKVILQFNDFIQAQYNIKLRFEIKGNGFTISTKTFYNPPPITLSPGQPLLLSGADLAPYLNTNNLDFVGINQSQYQQRMALPEGYYSICIKVYDYYNNNPIQISNEACAQAWFTLSDPPYLNLPFCNTAITPLTPQNILFQWTPVNMASPNSAFNTEYVFELFECRPDSNANPNQVVLSTAPIFSTTTQQTFINYGIAEPPLNLYMKYIWRVRAKDITGRDLFKNNGYSQICTFTNGTIKNIFGNTLGLTLTARAINHRNGECTFTKQSVYSNYMLQVRKQNTTYWFNFPNTTGIERIPNLEPNTVYECRVRGEAGTLIGDWSNTEIFKTLSPPVYSCNDNTQPVNVSQQPLPPSKAVVGLVIQSGQFEVVTTQIQTTGQPGWYKGKGYALVFGGLPVAVEWKNIYIDSEQRQQQGIIEAMTKGIDKWLNEWDVKEAENNATYVEGELDSVYVNGNQICYSLQGNATPICVPTPTGVNVVVIRDGEGNQWNINLMPPPPKVTGPFNYFDFSNDSLSANDSVKVVFKGSIDQAYGFDEKQHVAYHDNYEIIKLKNGKSYYVPNKSINEDASDQVIATYTILDFDQSKLEFRTNSGAILQRTSENGAFKITGIPSSATSVYAWYNNKKIGKLNIISLKSITKRLILVPVNGVASNITASDLNGIFKQACVNWSMSTTSSFTFNFGNDGLEVADATLFSKYSPEMRALRDAYRKKDTAYDKKAYYIFVIPSFSDPSVKGYMVRGRAVGFITSNAAATTVAHELAHGAFALEHTFPKIEKKTCNNLMDYTNKTTLIKQQWEAMRNPALLPCWEDSEENASYQTDGHYSTIYLIGKMLGIPNYNDLAWFTEFPDNAIHDKSVIVRTTWSEREHQLATHALTNGYHSIEEFKTSIAFLNTHFTNYQEMGRLLHRYGDCFAHTRLESRILDDSLKRMYGKPIYIDLGYGLSITFDYTTEHFSCDKSKPDIIGNDPDWYLSYVKNVSDLIATKFNKNSNLVSINFFKSLAYYARWKKVSLIGLIDYEIAKLENKKQFTIRYPNSDGTVVSLSATADDQSSYEVWLKNTEEYLIYKKVKYTIERKFGIGNQIQPYKPKEAIFTFE
jgi:hypothetical protein